MEKVTKIQYRYGIEFESWNEQLTKYETGRAILSIDRKIEFFSENEIIKNIPVPRLRIISIRELADTEVIF